MRQSKNRKLEGFGKSIKVNPNLEYEYNNMKCNLKSALALVANLSKIITFKNLKIAKSFRCKENREEKIF